jgi:anti-sigma factor RsiW
MGISQHLTAGQLAAYLDDALGPAERLTVEGHLDECVECREELVAVAKITAPEMTPARSGFRTRRWWVPAAVAAGVGALTLFRPTAPTPPATLERPGGASESMPRVTVVAPSGGVSASGRDLVFTWRALAADTYRLTLLTETGELVWTLDSADTVAALPSSLVLTAGASYFWRVEAIADGISASSGVQRIEIAP